MASQRSHARLFVSLVAVAFCAWAFSCAASNKLTRPTYEVSLVDEGWQQSTVTAIVQGPEGYLWLGSYHGLVRFDGVRFTVFNSGNTPGLVNGLITSLMEDDRGWLWIGHETGELTQYRAGEFKPVALPEGWPGGVIEAIGQDEAQDVWLLNNSGTLFRVRDGALAQCPGGGKGAAGKACLVRGTDRSLWVVSNGIAAVLKNGSPVQIQFEPGNSAFYCEQIAPAREGGLWVFGAGRLREWKDGKWSRELSDWPGDSGTVSVIMEAQSGDVFVGTQQHGLFLLHQDSTPDHFSHTNGLSKDWVRALHEDREGNIWVGTGGGLDVLRHRKIIVLNPADQWAGCSVLSLAFDKEGAAWIGTEGAGLYRYAGGQWQTFGLEQGVSNMFVWSVCETRDSRLLVGTWGGGLLTSDGEQFHAEPGSGQIAAPVLSMLEGKKGELWIGTTSGLYRSEHGRVSWFAGKDQLVLPDVRAIAEADDGSIWFGMSGGGLGRLKEGVLKQFRKSDGTGSNFILCLHTDADGTLWYGSADNGLGRWKDGKFSNITPAHGLPSEVICHIVQDDAGFLWMSSHRGIFRISHEELNKCADGLATSIQCLVYGRNAGLPSLTCSGGFQPGATKAPDGRLWFPTAKGVAIVNPLEITTNKVVPPVLIEALVADGEVVGPLPEVGTKRDPGGTLQIRPGKRRFDIQYTGLSFTAPGKVRFRYRLEGLENEWQEAGTKRTAEYRYLKPGGYRFQVIACNNDNVWNNTGATLSFTVLPYFWQTTWFQSACVLVLGASFGTAIFLGSRHRLRVRLDQLERQRSIERERTRIARDIHDDLGASLTRINMLSQSVRSELDATHQATADVESIHATARELTRAMDEIVWAVNPKHDTLDSLVTYLGRYAQSFLNGAGLRCRLDVPLNLPPATLTAEARHNLFLTLKEALNNVVKHAQGSEVTVSLTLSSRQFALVVSDNGCGFDDVVLQSNQQDSSPGRLSGGNGLSNMKRRLEEIGGHCSWESNPGQGTRLELRVPIPSELG